MNSQKEETDYGNTSNPPTRFPHAGNSFPSGFDSACVEFQYAVKIVSGRPTPVPELAQNIVSPGQYFTAINIHSPATCKTVTFRWKVAVANRVSDHVPGQITAFQSVTLRPDQAIEIDTPDVFRVTQSPFTKGFVVIESPCESDVVAVYTAGAPAATGGAPSPLVTFHTERVPGRRIEACTDDLKLEISTGVAEWTLISAVDLTGAPLPVAVPRPANAMENADRLSIWGTQPGSKWISVQSFANIPNLKIPGFVPGFYTFQYCFSLCSGFENARIDFKLLNDDGVVVWLNNTKVVGPLPGNLSGVPTPVSISSGLLPGQNCISIVVKNDLNSANPNPVGMNLNGTIDAPRGACPTGCGCCSDGGSVKQFAKPATGPLP